jgi:putative nucleotidyltransferase with HDIG domain
MLAPYALRPEESRGRRYPEPSHPYRSHFQRDRDRVVHSRAFRRLENKTQVFSRRYSDHFRNRLTHTIEVAQISRTIAAELGLNEELVEALALVHDVGHPPYGHAGERMLNELMRQNDDLFDHNLHALRIVDYFEQRYADFPGLNLSFEVREGIVKHSRDYDPGAFPQLAVEDVRRHPRRLLSFSPEIDAGRGQLKQFLYENVYYSPVIKADKEQGEQVIAELFEFFMRSPQELPSSYQDKLQLEPLHRVVCDYIAGMTDNYVQQQHRRFCIGGAIMGA